jgi:5-methylcytosine-specific restriction endonuclease McrA
MKKYTKTYLDYFDYPASKDTFVYCECCKCRASDIHHLVARGSGFVEKAGVNEWKNEIGNLMALCRTCHTMAESNKDFNEKLKRVHKHYVKLKKVEE